MRASRLIGRGLAGVAIVLLAAVRPQALQLTIDAPAELSEAASRVRAVDLEQLERDLRRAGLAMPAQVDLTLLRDEDPAARPIPRWVVGLAAGERDIVILPGRVLPYPYDSVESVFRHEVAHLALASRAGGRPLPRWFHEGVAMSVDQGWPVSGQLRLLLEMLRDPGTADLSELFASGAQPDAAQAYGLSAALVADLQHRHGPAIPGRIAERVAAGAPFARAFRLETGDTPDAAAARAWAAYRRWTNWVPALTGGSALWTAILALAAAAFVVQRRRRAARRRRWDAEEGLPPDA